MNPATREAWQLRLAEAGDVPALDALIPVSVRALQASHYSPAQMDAALGSVFAVDRALIGDGTYYVAASGSEIVACGGWSRRQSLYGGDRGRTGPDAELVPGRDPARIRAFFVHPDWARRGIGRALLDECERAMRSAGFTTASLVATLAGEPLYAAAGYGVVLRDEVQLAGGLALPVVRMSRALR